MMLPQPHLPRLRLWTIERFVNNFQHKNIEETARISFRVDSSKLYTQSLHEAIVSVNWLWQHLMDIDKKYQRKWSKGASFVPTELRDHWFEPPTCNCVVTMLCTLSLPSKRFHALSRTAVIMMMMIVGVITWKMMSLVRMPATQRPQEEIPHHRQSSPQTPNLSLRTRTSCKNVQRLVKRKQASVELGGTRVTLLPPDYTLNPTKIALCLLMDSDVWPAGPFRSNYDKLTNPTIRHQCLARQLNTSKQNTFMLSLCRVKHTSKFPNK